MNATFDMLPVGAKAVIISNFDEMNLMGFVGEVIGHLPERNRVQMKFERPHDDFHSCRGKCEYGYGFTVPLSNVLPTGMSDIQPDAAEPGDVCDITGEPADYRIGTLKFKKEYIGMVRKCDQCGEYHYLTDLHRDGDKLYCTECVFDNNWDICADCGAIIKDPRTSVHVNPGFDDEKYVCRECSNLYTECMHCGALFSGNHIKMSASNGCVCAVCSEDYTYCTECGDIIQMCDENLFSGSYYCRRHNPERIPIHKYSFKPEPVFYGDGDLYMGVELEVDDGNSPEDAADNVKSKTIYCKHDGSLSDDGIEVVTHPCTLEYHMEEFGWDRVIRTLLDYDYRSHDTDTCGLHVHANRSFFGDDREEQDYNISKVVMIVQRFWDKLVVFSRRSSYNLNRWAGKSDIKFEPKETKKSAADKAREESLHGDRYKAVNLQNSKTIEFRLFRGTLNLSTLLATLQFVDGLCRFAKNNEFDTVYSVSWDDFIKDSVFDYPELNNYLSAKNLLND